MHINCISCGHRFDVGKSYDDYEGLVKCPTCRALLDIKTLDGGVRSVRPVSFSLPATAPAAAPATNQPPVALPDQRQAA